MDGLKLQIQKSGDEAMQNAYYNGWLHDHLVDLFSSLLLPGWLLHALWMLQDHSMIQQLQKMVDFTLTWKKFMMQLVVSVLLILLIPWRGVLLSSSQVRGKLVKCGRELLSVDKQLNSGNQLNGEWELFKVVFLM
jgi:hypothetical protein